MVPKGLFQSLLSSSEPLKELSAGHGLVGLVAAMAAAETFLRSHECAQPLATSLSSFFILMLNSARCSCFKLFLVRKNLGQG